MVDSLEKTSERLVNSQDKAGEVATSPAPRRRGRPRKNPLPVTSETTDSAVKTAQSTTSAESSATGDTTATTSVAATVTAAAATTASTGEAAPAPRRRGRPRKNPPPAAAETPASDASTIDAAKAEAIKADLEQALAATQVAAVKAPATQASSQTTAVASTGEAALAPRRRGRPRKNPLPVTTETPAATTEQDAAVAATVAAAAELAEIDSKTAERIERAAKKSASFRTRQRERNGKRRSGDDAEELVIDEVLLPIAGILDLLDNYSFVRTSGYLAGNADVYVAHSQVKRYNLRSGDAIVGAIKQPKEGENPSRQRGNALVKIDSINGVAPELTATRADYADLVAVPPAEPIRIANAVNTATARAIDIFVPLAFGQRGIVASDLVTGGGVTTVLDTIAEGYAAATPDAHIMFVMLNARPEEVTEHQRSVNGEVIAARADQKLQDSVTALELALERAKRLVENGHDVVMLIDGFSEIESVPYLHPGAPKGVDYRYSELQSRRALQKLFAEAKNVENGGSLAVYVDSRALSDELSKIANWRFSISSAAAQSGIYPAVDALQTFVKYDAQLQTATARATAKKLRFAAAQNGVESVALQITAALDSAASVDAAITNITAATK
ncbi:hypothetical protein KJY77_00505 [Canibacter sp. lx-72]|uniref:hypothetical protein n=1 Tax=Canibacter zhuwentaonis TaxID=2837491 RepID=UPI001BDD9DAD|nr:hypothetical protein [Canibacter zhuwentaonis]